MVFPSFWRNAHLKEQIGRRNVQASVLLGCKSRYFLSGGALSPGETADASVPITNDSLMKSALGAFASGQLRHIYLTPTSRMPAPVGQRWREARHFHRGGANRGLAECTAVHQESRSILIRGEPQPAAVVCAFNKRSSGRIGLAS